MLKLLKRMPMMATHSRRLWNKPVVSVADKSLNGMTLKERHCLFSHEKKLNLFKNLEMHHAVTVNAQ